MNKLSTIIVKLVLLRGSSKLSIDERAAVGCAVQILSEVERMGVEVEIASKDFFYSVHPEITKVTKIA